MSEQKWTVGQQVLIHGRWGAATKVGTIARVLKKYVEVNGTAYNNDGYQRGTGDAWLRTRISTATPEQIKAAREENERLDVADVVQAKRFRDLSLSKLRRILAIVNEPEAQ